MRIADGATEGTDGSTGRCCAGCPQERTYIIGPHGGKCGTQKIDNFTDHIPDIFRLPVADVPIPYTELLITACPGYKKRQKEPDEGGAVCVLDSVSDTYVAYCLAGH